MNYKMNFMLVASVTSLIMVATGCGKKQLPEQPAKPADVSAATTAAATSNPAPVLNAIVIPETAAGDNSQVLSALTQALRKYAVENKRMPQNFSEVVSAGYVRNLPAPPPGKKFEIDAKTARVVLVNQ
jgi:hypothetical protein